MEVVLIEAALEKTEGMLAKRHQFKITQNHSDREDEKAYDRKAIAKSDLSIDIEID